MSTGSSAPTTADLVGSNNLEGLGNSISGLTRSLFDTIDQNASVSNLRLVDVNVTSSIQGVLALRTRGTVQTTSSSGTTVGPAGLIVSNHGLVQASHSDVTVNANSNSVGGLIADNRRDSAQQLRHRGGDQQQSV